MFPCRLEYSKTRTVPATLTDFVSNTINVDQVTQKPGLHLYALGVLFVTPVCHSSPQSIEQYSHFQSIDSNIHHPLRIHHHRLILIDLIPKHILVFFSL